MNGRIFSLYWDNVDPAIVAAQKSVFEHFDLPVYQHRIDGLNHGEWIDWTMTRCENVDVFLFIDIDCVPLSKNAIDDGFKKAAGGTLFGAEGSSNHIDVARSYVGAWYAFINRKVWDAVTRPSAKSSPHNDVCQLWTDVWNDHNLPITLLPPTASQEPKWDLPGRPQSYGIATTYGDHCFHLFESRHGKQELFLDRCRLITGTHNII